MFRFGFLNFGADERRDANSLNSHFRRSSVGSACLAHSLPLVLRFFISNPTRLLGSPSFWKITLPFGT